jgi:hypothetical protein
VWAIEEEPEEEEMMHGEMGYGSFTEGYGDAGMMVGKAKAVDIPAAKPKKRVRFALPGGDDGRGAY